ncbi:MAG: AI-2E family transporter [Alphaproteobacteria bacterium]|uniref:AI-2E family transporter n=1 Tax=Brevundimonas sp. TaxID=1871086 RepID=UPI001D1A8406|nr:AI-2E family transporter [Alphaproteobacteria bacterium]MBU1522975.1 AI-2E family transporter [Alphaproteobacteria bacterium]MBU2029555.1 AI-2E family transporter [Alphaproteobacteria bacterium]MBU2164312.1 AI-2E family transporter [Alphaproteobacteria bacterium]MBU2232196.1 AI-2E family transporter [Alphaproteobacteria bacterium]
MKNPLTMQSSAVSRNAAALIATVAAGAAVYWLRDILTPLAMALFLLIMIDGVKRTVAARTPLNDRWAGVAALVLVVLAFFASIGIIVNGAAGFFGEASGVSQNIGPRIDQIIRDVYGMARLNNPPTAQELINGVDIRGYVASIAIQAQGIASGAFFVMVYLGFLLASQIGFRRKIVAMFPQKRQRDEAIAVFERVRGGVEGYIWVQTVTGAMICVVAWILMRAVGLQNAEFWTFVIFIVGFIPVLGGAVAGLAPPLFALVQFPSYWPALILLVGLQTILFIVGNMIQPRMQGDNQNIDPVVVLLSLAFWGKLWGVVGMFLSTPLAVMAMAILAEFQGSRWMAILLSGDGEPYADEGKSNRKKAGETETETEGRAGA